MCKIIFSDIDGTLLDSKQRIPVATKNKIQELVHTGIPFVLASSRLESGVFPIMEELCIKAPVISYSGALIHDANRNVIQSLELSLQTAEAIHNFVTETDPSICCCTYSHDLWLTEDKSNPWLISEEKITKLSATQGKISDFPKYTGVHKLLCMGDKERIDSIADSLKRAFPKVYICRSKDTYLEINHPAASKANAMRFLCDYMGISLSETIAFGDGEVDLEMLQLADKGFAMQNAPDTVKRNVRYITKSNDDEGILSALKEMGL